MIKLYFKPNTTKLFILIGGNYTYEKVFCPSGCVDGACIHQCNNGMQDSDKIWGKTLSGYVVETKNESGMDCGGACDAFCPIKQECKDSDNTGVDKEKSFEIKGHVETQDEKGSWDKVGDDECVDNILIEHICDIDGHSILLYQCNICKDGACLPDLSCIDSDGGINASVKGTVTGKPMPNVNATATYADFCKSDSEVLEYSCIKVNDNQSKVIGATTVDCPLGILCEDGACTKPVTCENFANFTFSVSVVPELYHTPEHAASGKIDIKDAHALLINSASANGKVSVRYGTPFKKYADNKKTFETDILAVIVPNHELMEGAFTLTLEGMPVVVNEKEYKLVKDQEENLVLVITATEGGVKNNEPFSVIVLGKGILLTEYASADIGRISVVVNPDNKSITIKFVAYEKGDLLIYIKDPATGKMILSHSFYDRETCNEIYCTSAKKVPLDAIKLHNGMSAYALDVDWALPGQVANENGNPDAPAEESALFMKTVPGIGTAENDQGIPGFGQLKILPQADGGKPLIVYFETDEAKVKTTGAWGEINYLGNALGGKSVGLDAVYGNISLKDRVQPINMISQGKIADDGNLPEEVAKEVTDLSLKEWFVTKDQVMLTGVKNELMGDKLVANIPGDEVGCCIENAKKCEEGGILICGQELKWAGINATCQ